MRGFTIRIAALAALLVVPAGLGATAATYSFDVVYSGNGFATLAPGSDDPRGTALLAGDSFTYTLTTQGRWTVTSGGTLFPFIALEVQPEGERRVNVAQTLSNLGTTVLTATETDATNRFLHLGANAVVVPTGLVFDRVALEVEILASSDPSTTGTLLPLLGAPEQAFLRNISFSAAPVPEAATLALLGTGLLGLCLARPRRERRA